MKKLSEKRKYLGFYIDESNVEFLENLRFKLRRQNVSSSDIINLALEMFKERHEADEKKLNKNKKLEA